ncbi:hypothetical protein [Legionella saoudiensis]|uniref:hypothetical protein n=1 Tax=Legionella saoudiensis TaxID=1750561 RepID=UPI000730E75B|nr:hypothetical protein [Legionella saoudiensis]
MSNFFIYYGVNASHQLFICCYHDNFAAMYAFKALTKRQKISTTTKIGNLSTNEIEIGKTIINELTTIRNKIATSYPQITEVYYSGDINLGFGGQEQYPAFLMDGSLQKVFKSHQYFAKVPFNVCLESYNDEIAHKAAKIHKEHYAKTHNETYADCAVVIKSKLSVQPLYNSSASRLSPQPSPPASPKGRKNREILQSVTHLLRKTPPSFLTVNTHPFYQHKKTGEVDINDEVTRTYSPGQTRK